MWKALEAHYLSLEIDNQSKVYNDFLDLTFKGTNITNFLSNLATHSNNLWAVGLRIGIPKDFKLHKNILCENILQKIPSSLVHTWKVLIQNQSLNLTSLKKLRENCSRENVTIKVKTKESAMKATTSRSRNSDPICENGTHNPKSNHSKDQ